MSKIGDVIEMRVTPIAESIIEVTIGEWLKKDGDFVKLDEPLCEIETDKATQEFPATASGTLKIIANTGNTLAIGDLICNIIVTEQQATPTPAVVVPQVTPQVEQQTAKVVEESYAKGTPSPSANKILSEKGIDTKDVEGTGIGGRITKQDAVNAQKVEKVAEKVEVKTETKTPQTTSIGSGNRTQHRQKMTPLRKTIAKRLVAVKNETAMLTTFNEVNMKPIMDLRAKYKDEFKEKHQVGLGFMSFFTRACAESLKAFPEVNAMIDGTEIVYNDFIDISVAVSAPKGLVVPVLRNVENMSFSQIEKGIIDLATKAKNNSLSIEDMTGGTFTITNGGIFGSMLSTPIINAPQSAILGMHNIVERPMAVNGEVKILPIMYVAMSYDHRIIDGREAVGFLVSVKKYLENPERLLLGL
jgi:2-oxoglutarate dehydrogenase E2 component (dihydrolipoamide succinyltransferase)